MSALYPLEMFNQFVGKTVEISFPVGNVPMELSSIRTYPNRAFKLPGDEESRHPFIVVFLGPPELPADAIVSITLPDGKILADLFLVKSGTSPDPQRESYALTIA